VAHVREQPDAAADRALLTEALDGARVVAAEQPPSRTAAQKGADESVGAA
jgi:hypothetical protein